MVQVDARIYLWKWNTRVVISDVDGTITKYVQFLKLDSKQFLSWLMMYTVLSVLSADCVELFELYNCVLKMPLYYHIMLKYA